MKTTQLSIELRNEAYFSLEDLPEKRRKVFEVIQKYPDSTNDEIARKLDWTINRVTGRVTELRNAGLIFASGSRFNKDSGKKNTTWRVKGQI